MRQKIDNLHRAQEHGRGPMSKRIGNSFQSVKGQPLRERWQMTFFFLLTRLKNSDISLIYYGILTGAFINKVEQFLIYIF